jgi:hypothetical protein
MAQMPSPVSLPPAPLHPAKVPAPTPHPAACGWLGRAVAGVPQPLCPLGPHPPHLHHQRVGGREEDRKPGRRPPAPISARGGLGGLGGVGGLGGAGAQDLGRDARLAAARLQHDCGTRRGAVAVVVARRRRGQGLEKSRGQAECDRAPWILRNATAGAAQAAHPGCRWPPRGGRAAPGSLRAAASAAASACGRGCLDALRARASDLADRRPHLAAAPCPQGPPPCRGRCQSPRQRPQASSGGWRAAP